MVSSRLHCRKLSFSFKRQIRMPEDEVFGQCCHVLPTYLLHILQLLYEECIVFVLCVVVVAVDLGNLLAAVVKRKGI